MQDDAKEIDPQGQEPLDEDAQFEAGFDAATGATAPETEAATGVAEEQARQEEDRAPADAESAPQGEPETEPAPSPQDEDPAEQRRKAQMFDSQQGRLKQLQERQQQLEEELAAARASGGVQLDGAAPKPLTEVPEDIREDVEAFGKANPELAPLMVEDSKEGAQLRRYLEEYGPDSLSVVDKAERIAEKRERQSAKQAELSEVAAARREAHFAPIYQAHADYAEAHRSEDPAKLQVYLGRVHTWAEAKPGKEYEEIKRVLREGTPQEAVELLTRFKAETDPRRHDPTRAVAEAGMVPRSKPSPPPSFNEPDKDSFDAGWEAGVRKKKK